MFGGISSLKGELMFKVDSKKVEIKDEAIVTYLKESYLGEATIKAVSYLEAKTGAKGIDIQFETPEGGIVSTSVYFIDKTGETIDFTLSRIVKLMTICGKTLEKLKWIKGKNRFNKEAMICEELVGKEIKLYAQHKWEEYNGKYNCKHDILDTFYKASSLTPAEHNAGETHPERFLQRKGDCISRNETELKPAVSSGAGAPAKKNFKVASEEAF